MVVSGSVTSFNDASGDITLQLIPEGLSEPAYETTVKGNTVAYSFADVAAGTYTLKVSKANHATRECTVVVGTDDVVQNVALFLKGDVDNDGDVDMDDAIYLLFHVNFQDSYPVGQPANFDGLGEVTMDDAIYLLFHVNFQDSYPLH